VNLLLERRVRDLAVDKTWFTPSQIWEMVNTEMREKFGNSYICGVTETQAKQLVHDTRRAANPGGDEIRNVENQYGGKESEAFLRSSSTFVDKDGMQRQICFAKPALLKTLKEVKVRDLS